MVKIQISYCAKVDAVMPRMIYGKWGTYSVAVAEVV